MYNWIKLGSGAFPSLRFSDHLVEPCLGELMCSKHSKYNIELTGRAVQESCFLCAFGVLFWIDFVKTWVLLAPEAFSLRLFWGAWFCHQCLAVSGVDQTSFQSCQKAALGIFLLRPPAGSLDSSWEAFLAGFSEPTCCNFEAKVAEIAATYYRIVVTQCSDMARSLPVPFIINDVVQSLSGLSEQRTLLSIASGHLVTLISHASLHLYTFCS